VRKAQEALDNADATVKTTQAAFSQNDSNGKGAYYLLEEAKTAKSNAATDTVSAATACDSAKVVYDAYVAMEEAKAVYNAAYSDYYAAAQAVKTAKTNYDTALTAQESAQSEQSKQTAKLPDVLYYYNYNFYADENALAQVVVLPDVSEGSELLKGGKSKKQVYSEYGITYYDKVTKDDREFYYTYYLYILKHYEYTGTEADANVMSPMKFAVVRNNVYQMKIAGVEALGSASPDPTDPDPTDTYYPGPNPDEDIAIYLKMELQVRHWVLRDQGDIKLK
jgi:hypothetical protein